MKAAVISDIHSNYEALQVVIKDIKKRRIKKILCLGDIVGYAASPNECCEMVFSEADVIIAGNHDWAAVGKTDVANFNPIAAKAMAWTRANLSAKNAERLAGLPLTATVGTLTLVHATPHEPDQWRYIFSLEDYQSQFGHFATAVCLIGHSHIPGAAFQDPNNYTDLLHEYPFPLIKTRRYLVNVGSVGQPRDLDPRACYAIYDGNNNMIELVRLEYNIPLTEQKIIKAGLPEELAERLSVGK